MRDKVGIHEHMVGRAERCVGGEEHVGRSLSDMSGLFFSLFLWVFFLGAGWGVLQAFVMFGNGFLHLFSWTLC